MVSIPDNTGGFWAYALSEWYGRLASHFFYDWLPGCPDGRLPGLCLCTAHLLLPALIDRVHCNNDLLIPHGNQYLPWPFSILQKRIESEVQQEAYPAQSF